MPEQQNITNIPSSRVEVIDPRTGMISREWYRFFLNLFNLAGSGGNQTSLDDLQVGPPPQPATSSTGTVTSVGLELPTIMSVSGSPVTTSGVLTGTLTTQSVNTLFAGPSSGAAATPTFRALATADIPALAYVTSVALSMPSIMAVTGSPVTASGTLTSTLTTQSVNTLFAGPSSGAGATPTFRSLTTADIPALPYGTGTVTSVGLALPSIMSVSGSPVTGSGTLTGTLTTQAINRIFAGPSSGAAAAPTFRALATADIPSLSYVSSVGATAPITSTGGLTPTIGVTAAALNKTDDTNVTMTLSGSPSTALIAATTMALGWTGQLAVSRGGTGAALTTANFVFAGPTSGAPAAPTFRALTTADLSSLGYVTSVSGTTGRITSTGGTAPIIDLASGVIAAGTTGSVTAIPVITVDTYGRVTSITTAANPQGTVTSVGLSLPSIMSVSGSPVTSSGTLTGTLTTQAVNAIFAGPSSGAAAAPTFRALATADIPALSYVSSVSGTTGRITSTGGLTPVIDLASGVIAAGTTGSVTAIPVITVDTYGRVTSITTAANPQGTVTSVTGTSPVVSSGGATPAISLATAYGDTLNPYASKTANYFLGAPNGSAGVPIFRALGTADIPALSYVTSVALALPSIMSVSGSPVTSSGTLTGTLTTQSVNTLFAGPSSGAAAAPTFRALTTADIPALSYVTSVGATAPITSTGGATPTIGITAAALNKVDDTNVTMTLSGSPSTALIAATTMGLGWTGQLAVSRGGTGAATTTANFIFAGPSSGSPAAPTFRALTTADIPALAYGSVSSVALSLPSIMTVSGSPVTSSGTLTGTLTTQAVNAIFAGPSSGSAAAPTFRSLTTADIPTLNQNTTGTASNVTGVVAIVNGGTGQTTANTAFNALAPSQTTNSGKYLTTNGTDTSWATVGSSSNTSAFAFAWFIG